MVRRLKIQLIAITVIPDVNMNIFKRLLTQKKVYNTAYNFEKIIRILKNPKLSSDFNVTINRIDKELFNIRANTSIGVGTTSSGVAQPIQVYLQVVENQDSCTKLKIYTKPRWDLAITLFLAFIIPIIVLVVSDDWKAIVISFVVIYAAFFWFRLKYKLQEKALFSTFEKVLKLKHT